MFDFFKILTNPPAFSILSLADLEMKSVFIVNFSFNSPVPKTLSLTNLFLTNFFIFQIFYINFFFTINFFIF